MATPLVQSSFTAGELSPSVYGRVDLKKYREGCTTLRNMFVSYKGGATSRGGTRFAGQARQVASDLTPQLIPFQFSIDQGYLLVFSDQEMSVVANGAYVTENALSITNITQALPGVFTVPGNSYSTGDWVFLNGIAGMTELNGRTFAVVATGTTITLRSLLNGAILDTTALSAYVSGGTAAKIFVLPTPYVSADLQDLKWTQSADVMSITHPDHPPMDLTRVTVNNWTLTTTTFTASIAAPASTAASPSSTTTTSSQMTQYQYVVTAVDKISGEESVASPIATVTNSVNISITAGSERITWSSVTGSGYYNVYKATPAIAGTVPVGALFGFAGSSFGLSFVDTNITQDMTVTPPKHNDPFAPGTILYYDMATPGSGFTTSTAPTVTITDSTGTGASAQAVVTPSGTIGALIGVDGGRNYTSPSVVISGGATTASATAHIGPALGVYPSCVAYFQDRRFYANTINNPDTYFASQPGAFTNMDSSIPLNASDAIVGTPWAQQVNGIQAMVPMPGGLVVFTGAGAWQLNGGSAGAAVTPLDQSVAPQSYNGCHDNIRPIPVNFDILFVQEKGSIVRALNFNLFASIYTSMDLTKDSNHLFVGHGVERWDWAEEPNKLLWVVRDDGTLLCMTYLKLPASVGSGQDEGGGNVSAWSRHDTNGLFTSVACVTELPVDAPYFVVKRFIPGAGADGVYYIERMDNRLWTVIEESWCLDCALALPQPTPNATLFASSATGDGNITSYNLIDGGMNYTAPIGQIVDPVGGGLGASVSFTVSGGVITAATVVTPGSRYKQPILTILDTTGTGASIQPIVTNYATFSANAAVFTSGDVGSIIRMGGGKAEVVSVSGTTVTADILTPITKTRLNDTTATPIPAAPGKWTLTAPVSTLAGLEHLEGMTVGVLADGGVVSDLVVSDGAITLPDEASSIVVGLPFTAQLQTMYLEAPGGATVQTRRKDITQVVVRVEASRAPQVGINQPDAAAQPDRADVPWTGMTQIEDRLPSYPAGQPAPMFSGDYPITNVFGSWDAKGQIAVQQDLPVPLSITAIIPWTSVGDTPST